MLEEINATNAPSAVGPFSQAIKVGNSCSSLVSCRSIPRRANPIPMTL